MTESDEILVRQAQNGQRAAFEELVRRTSRLVFARLYLETGDTHRSEDILQETYLKAYRYLGQLGDPKGFRAWLLTMAVNQAVDAARREARQKKSPPNSAKPTELSSVASKAAGPEEEASRKEMRGKVLAVLRSLPEEYRLPLTLRYLGDADYDSIQNQLGLTNGSLRGLLHRGLKILRDRLGPEVKELQS